MSRGRPAEKPNWLPDWNEPKNYPGKRANHDWRWEFVRRNPLYRADFDRLIVPHIQSDGTIADGPGGAEFDHFKKTFGLALPLPPSHAGPAVTWVQSCVRGDIFAGHERHNTFRLGEFEAAVIFDLSQPLDDQIRGAKRVLQANAHWLVANRKMATPKQAKNHRDMYPLYLRLLDAESSGATQREMGDVLFSSNDDPRQSVKDGLRAAKLLRDRDFWRIRQGRQLEG